MLLPQILTTRANWAKSTLRVFCLADDEEENQSKQEKYMLIRKHFYGDYQRVFCSSMKLLLKKFRIPVSDMIVILDITAPPSAETRSWFDSQTRDLVIPDENPETVNTNGEKINTNL